MGVVFFFQRKYKIMMMSEDQKKQLESQLWAIANELRGKMDADEFRDYILGFIFYKYLSEKQTFPYSVMTISLIHRLRI